MDLEEHTIDDLADHCEECGAPLTDAEKEAALEAGGPVLCSVHAAEILEVDDAEDAALD